MSSTSRIRSSWLPPFVLISLGSLFLPLTLAAQAPDSVLPVAEVRIEPPAVTVESGGSARFTATAYDSSGAPMPAVSFFWAASPALIGQIDSLGTFVAGEAREGMVAAVAIGAPVVGRARVKVTPLPLATIRIDGPERVVAGSYVKLSAMGTDRAGGSALVADAEWRSSVPSVAEVEGDYLVAGSPGRTTLTAAKDGVEGVLRIRVLPNSHRALEIVCRCEKQGSLSASGPELGSRREVGSGEITIPVGEAIQLEARATGLADPAPARWWLEGEGALLDQRGNFVAQRPGRFVVMAQFGRLTSRWTVEARPRRAKGAFRLVGRGPVASPRVSDLWVFQGADGRDYAYTGSIGGDQVKVWDVTDPAFPVQMDSLVVDARVINDVNLNQTGKLGVLTREGASSRRNGIVLFDASDPAHPKITSEYTETVTSGVHNAFFDGDYIYATNDGTHALHVISAKDPLHPVEVARWEVRPGQTNKYLHDVIVQDGLAYLSYWDDGLVILDVGGGTKGGSPENPVFVSRIAYPEGHTHTAWRWKDYVFTGDEIFGGPQVTPQGGVPGGFLHVIDVRDIENPVEVAKYEVPGAGAHNIWMDEENEILYVSYYNAGVRALDVSGNLRGNLREQGRELAYFLTEEPDLTKAAIPNATLNWGPQLYKGNVFSSDMNSGLWVLRYEQEVEEGEDESPTAALAPALPAR